MRLWPAFSTNSCPAACASVGRTITSQRCWTIRPHMDREDRCEGFPKSASTARAEEFGIATAGKAKADRFPCTAGVTRTEWQSEYRVSASKWGPLCSLEGLPRREVFMNCRTGTNIRRTKVRASLSRLLRGQSGKGVGQAVRAPGTLPLSRAAFDRADPISRSRLSLQALAQDRVEHPHPEAGLTLLSRRHNPESSPGVCHHIPKLRSSIRTWGSLPAALSSGVSLSAQDPSCFRNSRRQSPRR